MSFISPNLLATITSLDGYVAPETETVESTVSSIVLPQLFNDDLFEDYLDDDIAELIKLALTEKELAYIKKKDKSYIDSLRAGRVSDAKNLGAARKSNTLGNYLASNTVSAHQLSTAGDADVRDGLIKEFVNDIREKYREKDLGLFVVLPSIIDNFVWRPVDQILSDFVMDEDDIEHISEVVGLELNTESAFIEVAYYWGILYNLFPDDQKMQVISTDHEEAWENVTNRGTVDQFLNEFLTASDIVKCISDIV